MDRFEAIFFRFVKFDEQQVSMRVSNMKPA